MWPDATPPRRGVRASGVVVSRGSFALAPRRRTPCATQPPSDASPESARDFPALCVTGSMVPGSLCFRGGLVSAGRAGASRGPVGKTSVPLNHASQLLGRHSRGRTGFGGRTLESGGTAS